MLDELGKIREAVTPKLPPARLEGFVADFTDFLGRSGILGLAVGFTIGLCVNKVVSALVAGIIMPIPAAFTPEGQWRDATCYTGC